MWAEYIVMDSAKNAYYKLLMFDTYAWTNEENTVTWLKLKQRFIPRIPEGQLSSAIKLTLYKINNFQVTNKSSSSDYANFEPITLACNFHQLLSILLYFWLYKERVCFNKE